MRFLIKKIIVIKALSSFLLLNTLNCFAQIKIPNPSFESDTVGINIAPKNWKICLSNPDIFPNIYDSLTKPNNGSTYSRLGWFYAIIQNPESIGCRLNCSLKKNNDYHFSIYISTINYFNNSIVPLHCKLIFWGSDSICSELEYLGEISPNYNDTIWHNYSLKISPKNDLSYFKISCYAFDTTNNGKEGALRIDNLSSIYIDSGYTNVKASANKTGNCTTLSCNFNEGVQNDYLVRWYKKDGTIISNNFTTQICSTAETIYYVWAKDSCGYYSTDSINIGSRNNIYYDAATRKLLLNYSSNEATNFELYNLLGQIEIKVVLDETLHQKEIILPSMPSSIYFGLLRTSTGKINWVDKFWIMK